MTQSRIVVGLSSRLSHNPALTDLHRSIVTPSACQGCTPGPLFGRHLLWSLHTWTWGQESMKRKRRKEGRRGPKSRVKQGCFNHGGVCLYIVMQGSFRQKVRLSKNTKTRHITTVTRGITTVTGPEDKPCLGNREVTK